MVFEIVTVTVFIERPLNVMNLCILVQNVSSSNHGFGEPIFAFFDILELNYRLTYAPREVRDLPRVDCIPDNILLA